MNCFVTKRKTLKILLYLHIAIFKKSNVRLFSTPITDMRQFQPHPPPKNCNLEVSALLKYDLKYMLGCFLGGQHAKSFQNLGLGPMSL